MKAVFKTPRALTSLGVRAKYLVLVLLLVGVANAAAADDELALRLSKLERALDNQGLLDLFQRLESLQAEVQSLRGQLEEQQYTIERLRQSQRDAYVDLDRRLQQSLVRRGSAAEPGSDDSINPPLTVYQPGEQPAVAGTPAPGINVQVEESPDSVISPGTLDGRVEDATVDALSQTADDSRGSVEAASANAIGGIAGDQMQAEVSPLSPDQAYREAFGLLKAGKYDESIESFNLFLLDYPNSEFADNSQYWLGETYFVKQEYLTAIEEYRKLIVNYPNSKKQSHALLKIGYSFQRLGELEKARAVLQDLQTRYPGSTASRLAAERLQQISAEAP
ncbi:MAG: tol-pal system protein YbgF [Gammaproteobacteria bacterium]